MGVRKLRASQSGFTLIEVLVALVVAAVALAALSRALGLTASNQANLEQKIAATWVAQDALLAKQLAPSSELPKKIEQSGRVWRLELQRSPSLMPNYQQVRLLVQQENAKGTAASLASIVRKP